MQTQIVKKMVNKLCVELEKSAEFVSMRKSLRNLEIIIEKKFIGKVVKKI